jgi:hypothetical protein
MSLLSSIQATVAEYPAVLVFGAGILIYLYLQFRKGRFSSQRPAAPKRVATLGTDVDTERASSFVKDVGRQQWLEQQQVVENKLIAQSLSKSA